MTFLETHVNEALRLKKDELKIIEEDLLHFERETGRVKAKLTHLQTEHIALQIRRSNLIMEIKSLQEDKISLEKDPIQDEVNLFKLSNPNLIHG